MRICYSVQVEPWRTALGVSPSTLLRWGSSLFLLHGSSYAGMNFQAILLSLTLTGTELRSGMYSKVPLCAEPPHLSKSLKYVENPACHCQAKFAWAPKEMCMKDVYMVEALGINTFILLDRDTAI